VSPSDPIPGGDKRVRDRRVLLVLLGCVVAVLGLDLISGLIPPLDHVLTAAPVLVLVLIAGTVVVLLFSVGRGRRA